MDDDDFEDDYCSHCDDGECGIVLDDEPEMPPKHFLLFNSCHLIASVFRSLAVWFVGNANYVAGRGATAQKKLDAEDFASNLGVFDE
jgi:hypothetical protein